MTDTLDILTADQAAELLQSDIQTIQYYCRIGKIPARKIGKSWRIGRAALMNWMENPEPEKRAAVAVRPVTTRKKFADNPFYSENCLA